jgi:hypothetical protein
LFQEREMQATPTSCTLASATPAAPDEARIARGGSLILWLSTAAALAVLALMLASNADVETTPWPAAARPVALPASPARGEALDAGVDGTRVERTPIDPRQSVAADGP